MNYMTPLQKRTMMFLIFCIGIRTFIAIYSKTASPLALRIMGYAAMIPAIGFMYIYATDSRKTGPETLGEPIWWNSLRPLHSLLYFMFAYLAINNSPDASKPLFIDVIVGFVSFIINHYLT